MVADKGKKSKLAERGPEDESDHIDGELVMNIEKLQEVQDELEKVQFLTTFLLNIVVCGFGFIRILVFVFCDYRCQF